jgi:hypothetical protein
MRSSTDTAERAALVIAHPGHELRVHGWVERARPLVFILTDGSGHDGRSRLASTSRVLKNAGAAPGSIYGRLSDRDLYQALLDRDFELFLGLADELAATLTGTEVTVVAGDAAEGFNPGHDVCRLLINAAVGRLGGAAPANYEFPLEAPPDDDTACGETLRVDLDPAALERKLAAARDYPEMAFEVERALARYGEAIFRTEWLRPVRYGLDLAARLPQPPFYETHGERRVAEGAYRQVLRFREHVAPLAEALALQPARPAVGTP